MRGSLNPGNLPYKATRAGIPPPSPPFSRSFLNFEGLRFYFPKYLDLSFSERSLVLIFPRIDQGNLRVPHQTIPSPRLTW